MVEKRKLTQEETNIYSRVVREKSEFLRRLEVRLREIDHFLIEGLWLNYLEKREEFETKKRDIAREMTECKISIDMANEFLINGVAEKKVKEDLKK